MFVITQTTAVHKFHFSYLLFILCPYLPSTPGREVFQCGFLRILFSGTVHRFLIGLSPPVGSLRLHSLGATAHGISLRFNAQPVTMQKYHYCCRQSSPHRICLTVSVAVASPEGSAVPRLAPDDRKVREELLFSCQVSNSRRRTF